jgi:hypothetical protein
MTDYQQKINEEIDMQLLVFGVKCPKSKEKYRQRVWDRCILGGALRCLLLGLRPEAVEISIDISHETIKRGKLKKTCECPK